MKKRLKMRITTVREQRIVSAAAELRLSCPVCEREVEMLSNVQAVTILGVNYQTLNQLVAAGRVHSIQTVSGKTWVCKESLFGK
jgi:Fe2+ or Zn2+ uptake regulation protein